jgi:hypothetical protein
MTVFSVELQTGENKGSLGSHHRKKWSQSWYGKCNSTHAGYNPRAFRSNHHHSAVRTGRLRTGKTTQFMIPGGENNPFPMCMMCGDILATNPIKENAD